MILFTMPLCGCKWHITRYLRGADMSAPHFLYAAAAALSVYFTGDSAVGYFYVKKKVTNFTRIYICCDDSKTHIEISRNAQTFGRAESGCVHSEGARAVGALFEPYQKR